MALFLLILPQNCDHHSIQDIYLLKAKDGLDLKHRTERFFLIVILHMYVLSTLFPFSQIRHTNFSRTALKCQMMHILKPPSLKEIISCYREENRILLKLLREKIAFYLRIYNSVVHYKSQGKLLRFHTCKEDPTTDTSP